MRKLLFREAEVREVVGAASMDEALALVTGRTDTQYLSARIEPYPTNLDEQYEITEYLRNQLRLPSMLGPQLYLVTTHTRYFVEIPDAKPTDDPGLAEQPGVPVAGDSQSSGEGSTGSGFGGPPTEA